MGEIGDESQYVIEALAVHTPKEVSPEEHMQKQFELQCAAMMAIFNPQQQMQFQMRQQQLMMCQTQAQAQKAMQDLNEWVKSELTDEQQGQLEAKLLEMMDMMLLQKATEECQQAQAEITNHCLDDEQKAQMQAGQKKAEKLQRQGDMKGLMKIVETLQEQVEETLTRKQRTQIKATFKQRCINIFFKWMEDQIVVDESRARQQKTIELLPTEARIEYDAKKKALENVPDAQKQQAMEELAAYPKKHLESAKEAEVEAHIKEKLPEFRKSRGQQLKETILRMQRETAASECLNKEQRKTVLQHTTKIQQSQAQGDEQGTHAAAAQLDSFMNECLSEEDRAKVQAEIDKVEADIDSKLADASRSASGALPTTDCKAKVEKTFAQLKDEISKGGEEKETALNEMKELLEMMESMKAEYGQYVEDPVEDV